AAPGPARSGSPQLPPLARAGRSRVLSPSCRRSPPRSVPTAPAHGWRERLWVLQSSFLLMSYRGRLLIPLVPPMERREIARVPLLPQPGLAQVPVGPDLPRYLPQVVPEVHRRRAAPEPVAHVDAVDHEVGLEHQRVRNHRVVLGVGILL